jgi:hypothetical protein
LRLPFYALGFSVLTTRQKSRTGASKKRSHDAVEKDKAPAAGKASESNSTKGSRAKKAKTDGKDTYDVKDMHLDGEEGGCVPVFDTCADIRRKISAHERKGVTTKKFMLESFHASAQQYKTFMKGSKSMQGAEKDIFYGAYVYFEKLRIKQGGKKTKKREEMEKIWAPEGVPRTQTDRLTLFRGERAFFDQYGQLEISGGPQH